MNDRVIGSKIEIRCSIIINQLLVRPVLWLIRDNSSFVVQISPRLPSRPIIDKELKRHCVTIILHFMFNVLGIQSVGVRSRTVK